MTLSPPPAEKRGPNVSSVYTHMSQLLTVVLICVCVDRECPELKSGSGEAELLNALTAPCRYDRWARPGNKSNPVNVTVRLHVYFLGAIEAQSLVSPKLSFSKSIIYLSKSTLLNRVFTNDIFITVCFRTILSIKINRHILLLF